MYPDLMPEVFDGASLGKKMAECCEENSHILIPRAAIGNAEIIRELSVRKDLVVDDVATYETRYEVQSIVDESGAFERGEIDYAVFTSASTVRGFVHALPGLEYSKVKAVCIGKQTAAQAEEYGMHTYTAKEASIDSLVELVIQLAGEKK